MSRRCGLSPASRSLPFDGEQPLLRLQQHAEAGAGDVFEPAAVERHRALDPVEERLRGRAPARRRAGRRRRPCRPGQIQSPSILPSLCSRPCGEPPRPRR